MNFLHKYRILPPRAILRRARTCAVALENACPAAFFLLAAVTAVLSARGNGFPFVLIPTAGALLVWALLPVRDALLRFALPMLPVLVSSMLWSAQLRNFIDDAPKTNAFGEGSAPRTLHYIGWQIVKQYMKKSGRTVEELLGETDSQKILTQSGWRP